MWPPPPASSYRYVVVCPCIATQLHTHTQLFYFTRKSAGMNNLVEERAVANGAASRRLPRPLRRRCHAHAPTHLSVAAVLAHACALLSRKIVARFPVTLCNNRKENIITVNRKNWACWVFLAGCVSRGGGDITGVVRDSGARTDGPRAAVVSAPLRSEVADAPTLFLVQLRRRHRTRSNTGQTAWGPPTLTDWLTRADVAWRPRRWTSRVPWRHSLRHGWRRIRRVHRQRPVRPAPRRYFFISWCTFTSFLNEVASLSKKLCGTIARSALWQTDGRHHSKYEITVLNMQTNFWMSSLVRKHWVGESFFRIKKISLDFKYISRSNRSFPFSSHNT